MRGKIAQDWFKRAKVIRAAIRLKYTLMAEDEINTLLDAERKKFMKTAMQGQLPAPLDPKKALKGD